MRLTIEPARPEDESFVYDSWLRSWHEYHRATHMSVWAPGARQHLDRVLRSGPVVWTARDPRSALWMAGWLVATASDGEFLLHWAYTKVRGGMRRRGVFSALLAHALREAGQVERLRYATNSRISAHLERIGFRYAPPGAVKGGER